MRGTGGTGGTGAAFSRVHGARASAPTRVGAGRCPRRARVARVSRSTHSTRKSQDIASLSRPMSASVGWLSQHQAKGTDR